MDFNKSQVTTTKGRQIHYDLLVASDGVHSRVRKQLVQMKAIKEKHRITSLKWKAIRMPPQRDLKPDSSKPLSHKSLVTGRVLARYPEGHIFLLFWGTKTPNPGGVQNKEELKQLLNEVVQDKQKRSYLKSIVLPRTKKRQEDDDRIDLVFYDKALDQFLEGRPGISHYLKVTKFHYKNVALVGDAAHGMYNLLGQGCSCGFSSARSLADNVLHCSTSTVQEHDNINRLEKASERYTQQALPEAHAITDLNLIGNLYTSRLFFLQFFAMPLVFIQSKRGKSIIELLLNPEVPYLEILKANWTMI